MSFGGSNIRPESTGYGTVYFGEVSHRHKLHAYCVKACTLPAFNRARQPCAAC